jgi:hypothetical protein
MRDKFSGESDRRLYVEEAPLLRRLETDPARLTRLEDARELVEDSRAIDELRAGAACSLVDELRESTPRRGVLAGVRRGILEAGVLVFEAEAKENGREVVGVIGGKGERARRGVGTGSPLRLCRRGVARWSSSPLVLRGVEKVEKA